MDGPNKHETENNQTTLRSQAIQERPAEREAAQTSAPTNNAASDTPNKPHSAAAEAKTTARAKAPENAREELPRKGETRLTNVVESDEILTARQGDSQPVVPLDIEQQYVRVGNRFYHPKNTKLIAFEDKGNRLETKSNSENIAESMVRIAEARGWDEIKVSGSETFRREVWLEAATRGMRVKGYFPNEQDKAALAARSRELATNTIERDRNFRGRENNKDASLAEAFAREAPAEAVKQHPELAGAAAAVMAIDKKAKADGLTLAQREIVAARARQNAVNSIMRGNMPEVTLRKEVQLQQQATTEEEHSR